ncbi:MAG: LysR family transcriptional regulator [Boseongicola sp. SB0676_bin_33]|nr:LysR family transcriptional regulator [Boseongicola sp. SB0676_bin_33]
MKRPVTAAGGQDDNRPGASLAKHAAQAAASGGPALAPGTFWQPVQQWLNEPGFADCLSRGVSLQSEHETSHVHAMVADVGSIRSAAQVLGKTQPAPTKQIRQLEEETGLALFFRTSRGVIPTEAGIAVLSRARVVQADLARLDDEASALRGTNSGVARVSATPRAAVKLLREGRHDIVIGPHAGTAKTGIPWPPCALGSRSDAEGKTNPSS